MNKDLQNSAGLTPEQLEKLKQENHEKMHQCE